MLALAGVFTVSVSPLRVNGRSTNRWFQSAVWVTEARLDEA